MNAQTCSNLSLSLDELIAKSPTKFNHKAFKKVKQSSFSIKRKLNSEKKKQPTLVTNNSTKITKTIQKGKQLKNVPNQKTNNLLYTVKVTGLGDKITEDMIKSRFGVCGKVLNVNMLQNGIAYVAYADSSSCSNALRDLQGTKIKGEILSVQPGRRIQNKPNVPNTAQQAANAKIMQAPNNTNNLKSLRKLNSNYENMYNNNDLIVHPKGGHMFPNESQNFHKNYLSSPFVNKYSANGYNMNQYMVSPVLYSPTLQAVNKQNMSIISGKTDPNHATVIVSNVPLDLTAQEIKDAFCCVGAIAKTEVLLNGAGAHTGRAAVVYESRLCAEEAVRRFDGGDLNSNKIRLFLE